MAVLVGKKAPQFNAKAVVNGTSVEANFTLTSQNFNYLFMGVGNNGIGLKTIKLGVNIDGNIHNIYTKYFNNIFFIFLLFEMVSQFGQISESIQIIFFILI